jgi:hypothetical protein
LAAFRPVGWAASAPRRSVREKGERLIWLEERWLNKLTALYGPAESYSDVILRMAEIEASRPGRWRRR